MEETKKQVDQICESKLEFNKNRKIVIKDIPPMTYEEIKSFLSGHSISTISISKKSRRAIVTLLNGEEAESICQSVSGQTLFQTEVKVEPYHHELMLCVSHLPKTVTLQQFKKFLSQYGAMERCFLMYDSRGESKEYGFVEFMHNKEKITAVMKLLHGLPFPQVQGAPDLNELSLESTMQCHFLNESVITFEDLNSKMLLIGQLPFQYVNEKQLREIFSFIQTPVHFELITVEQKSMKYGLAEYSTAEICEKTWQSLNGYKLNYQDDQQQDHNRCLDVSFCTPGQSRDQIYDSLTNTLCAKKTLPSLMSLPILPPDSMGCAQSGPSLLGAAPFPPSFLMPPPSMGPAPRAFGRPHYDIYGNRQGGLEDTPVWMCPMVANFLGPTPHLFKSFEVLLRDLYEFNAANDQYVEESLNEANMQIALLAMLLSMQLQESQPALMQNPLMQTWIKSTELSQAVQDKVKHQQSLLGNPMISHANGMLQDLMHSRHEAHIYNNGYSAAEHSDFKTPERKKPTKGYFDEPADQNNEDIAENTPTDYENVSSTGKPIPSLMDANLNNTIPSLLPQTNNGQPSATKAIPSLLDNLNSGDSAAKPIPSLLDEPKSKEKPAKPIPSLMAVNPFVPPEMADMRFPPPQIPDNPANPALTLFFENQIQEQIKKIDTSKPPPVVPLMQKSAFVVDNTRAASVASSDRGTMSLGSSSPTLSDSSGTSGFASCSDTDLLTRTPIKEAPVTPQNSKSSTNDGQTLVGSLIQNLQKFFSKEEDFTEDVVCPADENNDCVNDVLGYIDGMGVLDIETLTSPQSIRKAKSRLDNSKTIETTIKPLMTTPVGYKRGLHLLPSPEESPEGTYIGQHSQGLGGHYAESYIKRRRMDKDFDAAYDYQDY